MTTKIHLPLVRAALAATLLVTSAAAMADTHYSTARVTVVTAGIDLSTAKGAAQLGTRVDVAIRSMCGQPVFGTRDEADALAACHAEARAGAEPAIRQAVAAASIKFATIR